MKARLLTKKYTFLDLVATGVILTVFYGFLAWGFNFTYNTPKLDILPHVAGQPPEKIRAMLGNPRRTITPDEFQQIIASPRLDWSPKPESSYDCDAFWYYELAPNRFTYLFYNKSIVTQIYVGTN